MMGGAGVSFEGKAKYVPPARQMSADPDVMNMWRQQARSNRLIEVMSDDGATEAAIESRPAPHKIPATAEINLHHALEMATHRKCGELWRAYGMCKETTKQGHEKCKGWYMDYTSCLDKSATSMVLEVLQTMTKHDTDLNVQKLRD